MWWLMYITQLTYSTCFHIKTHNQERLHNGSLSEKAHKRKREHINFSSLESYPWASEPREWWEQEWTLLRQIQIRCQQIQAHHHCDIKCQREKQQTQCASPYRNTNFTAWSRFSGLPSSALSREFKSLVIVSNVDPNSTSLCSFPKHY